MARTAQQQLDDNDAAIAAAEQNITGALGIGEVRDGGTLTKLYEHLDTLYAERRRLESKVAAESGATYSLIEPFNR